MISSTTKKNKSNRPFIKVDATVYRDPNYRMGPFTRATYHALLSRRNRKDGRCYPCYKTIAKDANISLRSAIRHVKKLEGMRVLTIQPRYLDKAKRVRTSNQYNLVYPEKLAPLKDTRKTPRKPPPKCPDIQVQCQPVTTPSDTESHKLALLLNQIYKKNSFSFEKVDKKGETATERKPLSLAEVTDETEQRLLAKQEQCERNGHRVRKIGPYSYCELCNKGLGYLDTPNLE